MRGKRGYGFRFRHRRLPIYDETVDTIVGVLNTRRLLLNPQIDLAEAIEFPSFVPDSMNLLQLFQYIISVPAIFGLTRGTTNAHIARACLESIAFQTKDVLDAMADDAGIPITELLPSTKPLSATHWDA